MRRTYSARWQRGEVLGGGKGGANGENGERGLHDAGGSDAARIDEW